MKKFFSALLTGFALFFSIPAVLILASWNAIPGQGLYSVKSSLEDVALALTINTPMSTAFSVNFTDRRYTEAVKLLDREGSTVGYELLVAEAQQARGMVIKKQDVKNGAQLVRKIEEYQVEIEEKRVEVQSQTQTSTTGYQAPSPTLSPATPAPVITEKKKVSVVIPVEIVIENEEPEEVLENLEEAQEELEKILTELEEELPATAPEEAIELEVPSTEAPKVTRPDNQGKKKDKDEEQIDYQENEDYDNEDKD